MNYQAAFLVLLFCVSFQQESISQIAPCPVPDALLSSLYEEWDIPMLALEQMAGSPEVEVPESLKAPIRDGFAALYYAADSIPEADSMLNIFCIHHFPSITQSFYAFTDPEADWVQGWMEQDSITTNSTLDSVIDRYDLEVHHDGAYGYIETTRVQNLQPVIELFNSVDGVLYTEEGGFIGDGSNIEYSKLGDVRYFKFKVKWGDCPAGCTGERHYNFEVRDNCAVNFTSATTVKYLPFPPPMPNCNLTSGIAEPQGESVLTFRVFPNPASDNIAFQWEGAGNAPLEFVITDLSGKVLLGGSAISGQQMDIGNLAQGLYILRVTERSGSHKSAIASFVKTQ